MSEFAPPVPLTAEHRVEDFRCGKAVLDEFLIQHALGRQSAMLSRTYVVTPAESDTVVAYSTLAHTMIAQEQAPKKIGRGMPAAIPALLLARLAVDSRYQGFGLGRALFGDAVKRTWAAIVGSAAPVRFFVVDAMDEEAKAFYERLGMIPSPTAPMRLFLHYKDLETTFRV